MLGIPCFTCGYMHPAYLAAPPMVSSEFHDQLACLERHA